MFSSLTDQTSFPVSYTDMSRPQFSDFLHIDKNGIHKNHFKGFELCDRIDKLTS